MTPAIHPALPLPNLKQGVASAPARMYRPVVAAKSAAQVWRPGEEIGAQAPHPTAGAFFVPAVSCYGGCAWETFGSAGFQFPRFANLRTAATLNRLATIRGSSLYEIGATPMHALNPSKIRAYAHRRLALAALRANSSLSVRIARYNHHAEIARALEGQGGAQ